MMKTYLDEHGRVIDSPAAVGGSVYIYSTSRGDFVFPVEGRLLTLTAEHDEEGQDPRA